MAVTTNSLSYTADQMTALSQFTVAGSIQSSTNNGSNINFSAQVKIDQFYCNFIPIGAALSPSTGVYNVINFRTVKFIIVLRIDRPQIEQMHYIRHSHGYDW